MEIETILISKINPAVYNPRKDLQPGDPEYEKLKKSLKEFDLVEPLIWNKKSGNLIGGHQRLKILQEQGKTEVDVSVVDLTDSKEKALNLALNKISGEWDMPKLKDLLEEIDTGDFDIEITGFGTDEIEDLMTQLYEPDENELDDVVPEVEEAVAKVGDVFKLGEHRLLCGDATKIDDVEKLMDGQKADMVFTDPPYGMFLNADWSKAKSNLKFYKEKKCKGQGNKYNNIVGDHEDFNQDFINNIFSLFGYCKEIFLWGADYYTELLLDKNNGSFFVWDKRSNDGTDIDKVKQSDKMYGSCFELCWSKNRHRREIVRVKWAGIFGTEKEPDKDKGRKHPTQKPVLLSEWFVSRYSKKDNLIIDLFGGSGSTLIASEKLNRKCYMMELDPHYCDVIVKRWEDYTGKKAELIK